MKDKWVDRALVIEQYHEKHEVDRFKAHGDLICLMIKKGEYKVIAKAGLHISNGLAKTGRVLSTGYIYASAKAAQTWNESDWDMLRRTFCPVSILQVLAYRELDTFRDIVASVANGETTWAKFYEKNQKKRVHPNHVGQKNSRDYIETEHTGLTIKFPVYGSEEERLDAMLSLMSQLGPEQFTLYYRKAAERLRKNGVEYPML